MSYKTLLDGVKWTDAKIFVPTSMTLAKTTHIIVEINQQNPFWVTNSQRIDEDFHHPTADGSRPNDLQKERRHFSVALRVVERHFCQSIVLSLLT